MNDPQITVLMSVYNTPEEWLSRAIDSILTQTFDDFEFVIILDHPTDNSAKVVKGYAEKDSRIVVVENTENLGLTKSLNKGLAVAKGKYIARMDADDVAFRHRFEKQYQYMESHPEVVALGTQICTSLDSAHALDKFPVSDWTPDQDVLKIRMLFHNVGLPHPTSMLRHDVMLQHGITYDERIKKSQDYKLWTDLMRLGRLDMLDEVLLLWRIHENQISSNRGNQYIYAHMVAVEQARELLGEMTESEEKIHASIMDITIEGDNLKAYKAYLNRLIRANDEKGIYDRQKFRREINYLWCKKAYRRIRLMKKADMLFCARIWTMMQPSMLMYIREDKKNKARRKYAAANMNAQDCLT